MSYFIRPSNNKIWALYANYMPSIWIFEFSTAANMDIYRVAKIIDSNKNCQVNPDNPLSDKDIAVGKKMQPRLKYNANQEQGLDLKTDEDIFIKSTKIDACSICETMALEEFHGAVGFLS